MCASCVKELERYCQSEQSVRVVPSSSADSSQLHKPPGWLVPKLAFALPWAGTTVLCAQEATSLDGPGTGIRVNSFGLVKPLGCSTRDLWAKGCTLSLVPEWPTSMDEESHTENSDNVEVILFFGFRGQGCPKILCLFEDCSSERDFLLSLTIAKARGALLDGKERPLADQGGTNARQRVASTKMYLRCSLCILLLVLKHQQIRHLFLMWHLSKHFRQQKWGLLTGIGLVWSQGTLAQAFLVWGWAYRPLTTNFGEHVKWGGREEGKKGGLRTQNKYH